MKNNKNRKLFCLLVVCGAFLLPVQAENVSSVGYDNIGKRIEHQKLRIKNALSVGTVTPERAKQLNQSLDDLAKRTADLRAQNGGTLKPEDLLKTENVLNQNNQLIMSFEGAGKSVSEPGSAIGPAWSTGPNGAQDPGSLLKKMKAQERQQLRQEKQALEQKLEQQQLDYERAMIPKLGNQRKDILKQEGEVKQIRSESGAN